MRWLQDHGWVVGLIVAAALAVAGLAWWGVRRRPPATPVPGAAARRRVDLAFAAAVVITLAVGWWAVVWLVEQADQVTDEKAKAAAKADAVRTGAAIALGTGGAAYLLLAYRRQRLEEVDTRERRITELYTKAVEQLGHEKAPVRLGALYSLERLAQNDPEHRQTVVDVFCAYLRMPYTPPARDKPGVEQVKETALSDDAPDLAPNPALEQDPAQELQVRRTAQRILAAHLRLPPGTSSAAAQRRRPSPGWGFWPGISLDLTGATLIELGFALVSVVQARFNRATFHLNAQFEQATFQGSAFFEEATFRRDAQFNGATFHRNAQFDQVTFKRGAWFKEATFETYAVFYKATFKGKAVFEQATFKGKAVFEQATFDGKAVFEQATFISDTGGDGVTKAQVLHLDDPDLNKSRIWPDGYIVRPDPADPTRGTLVKAEQMEEPEQAIPPSESTGR